MVLTRSALKAILPPWTDEKSSEEQRRPAPKVINFSSITPGRKKHDTKSRAGAGAGGGGGSTRTPSPARTPQDGTHDRGYDAAAPKAADKNDQHQFEYEFGGPISAIATTVLLPIVTLLLTYWASIGHVDLFYLEPSVDAANRPVWTRVWDSPVMCPGCRGGGEMLIKCAGCVVGWLVFQVVLERLLPCELVKGAVLKGVNARNGDGDSSSDGDGEEKKEQEEEQRLTYRINGHIAFRTTMRFSAVGWPSFVTIDGAANAADGSAAKEMIQFGWAPLGLLYYYHAKLVLSTIVLCTVLLAYLFVRSHACPNLLLAEGGNSGSGPYDIFTGWELNPQFQVTETLLFNQL